MKFQSNCNCNRLHLHVIDPNSVSDSEYNFHSVICRDDTKKVCRPLNSPVQGKSPPGPVQINFDIDEIYLYAFILQPGKVHPCQ